jgi:ribosomal protein L11 methyltransferase
MPAPDRWIEISASVPPEDVDAVAAVLSDFTDRGIVIEPAIRPLDDVDFGYEELDAPSVVRAFVAPPLPARARDDLARRLAALPTSQPIEAPRYRELNPADWAEEWKRFYDVQHIGRRLVVRPSWLTYDPRPHEVVIELDPGAAFGTGQHATTRLCLAALDGLVHEGSVVLDVGCGSGILAVAAARLGAATVRAVDNDPDTIEVTVANARANAVAARIDARPGTLGADWPWPDPPEADAIVANISSATVLALLPAIRDALRPGGHSVLSGFLARDAETIAEAATATGLEPRATTFEGEWACIVAARPTTA